MLYSSNNDNIFCSRNIEAFVSTRVYHKKAINGDLLYFIHSVILRLLKREITFNFLFS